MIRDQLAEHTTDPKLREKLFMAPDDMTLSKAVEIAFQLESAALLASQLAASDPAPSRLAPLAQTVALTAPLSEHTSLPDELEVNVAGRRGATARQSCGNCGSSSHSTRAPACPAMGQRCQRCGKLNHFSKVCRSAPAPVNPRSHSSIASNPTTIHSVDSSTKPFKWCTVELDGVSLSLLLDTAASRSLLNEATVRRLFPRLMIKPGADDLYGYGHVRIGMVGTATFAVRYGSRTHGANLLGLTCSVPWASPSQTTWVPLYSRWPHPGCTAGLRCSLGWVASLPLTTNRS